MKLLIFWIKLIFGINLSKVNPFKLKVVILLFWGLGKNTQDEEVF
jgi:hypothetical protein